MRMCFVVVLVFFVSYTHASEVSSCDSAPSRTLKLELITGKPGDVHVISHCKQVRLEDLGALDPEEAAAVSGWPKKIKDLDLSRSVYRYYLIVNNDHGGRLQVEFSEWKVVHAHHLAVVGNGIEIPPCVVVALTFLSPGVPRTEMSYIQISLPDEKGGWSAVDQPRSIPLHVSTSPHFVRSAIRVRKIPQNDAVSIACK